MVAYSPGTFSKNTLARASAVQTELAALQTELATVPTAASLNEGRATYAADTGSANAYLVALPVTLTSYTAGLTVMFKASAANTGATTLNVDSVGVKNILRHDLSALSANDITINSIVTAAYDGTQFLITGVHGSDVAAVAASATTATTQASNAATSATAAKDPDVAAKVL